METDLELARRAALTGAAVALRYFAALARLPREVKADGSVVTEADRAVEAAIRAVLTGARPADAVLGEEGGQTGDAGRRWIIDPIDGTALFVAGDDRWLVLVALEEAGEVRVGVAAVPAQRRLWWAGRGAGAFTAEISGPTLVAPRRIRVARDRPDDLPASRFGVVPPADRLRGGERDLIAPLAAVTATVPWITHPGLLVAAGRLDLAVQTGGQAWDYAAPSLILTEAGGCFGGLDGSPRPEPGPALYASGPALHRAARRVLRPGPGEPG
ncbi:inositol monophosphatase family protein [Plantactinospora siamensis]|uniref:inositol-phosphate phosphatase n=1 Tax=Plantactinospora siamensis TaxID=555372 RepID=A0ABV6P4U0_9ACTN